MVEKIYDFLFFIFSGLCHQITERSFCSIGGYQFFVCSRDTGTYIGFLLSFIIIFLLSKLLYKDKNYINNLISNHIKIIIFLFLFYLFLFGIDGITSYSKLRETTNYIRYFTGLFMASHLGLIFKYFELSINKALYEQSDKLFNNRNSSKSDFIKFILLFNFLVFIFYLTSLYIFLPYLIYLLPIFIFFYFYKIIKLITDLIYFQVSDLNNKYLNFLPYIVFTSLTFLLIFFLFSVGYFKESSIVELYQKFIKK
jgi:uncharacterized membrane protein